MQEIFILWEGDNHRYPGVKLSPTGSLEGTRLRIELKGRVADSGVNQIWNGNLDRQ